MGVPLALRREYAVAIVCAFLAALAVPFVVFADVSPGTVVSLTNADRTGNGVRPLVENPLLDRAAQMKADDMLAKQYYSHTSPEGYLPFHWLDAVGYKYLNVGENLDLTYVGTNEAVNAEWMNSPEHRTAILLPQFTETGAGVASGLYQGKQTTFVVEIFATPLPVPAPVTLGVVVGGAQPALPTLVPGATSSPPSQAASSTVVVTPGHVEITVPGILPITTASGTPPSFVPAVPTTTVVAPSSLPAHFDFGDFLAALQTLVGTLGQALVGLLGQLGAPSR